MPELSDADVFGSAPSPSGEMSDADVFGGAAQQAETPSLLQQAIKPLTDIPSAYTSAVNQSVGQMEHGAGQIASGDPWTMAKGASNVALGGLGYATAPISAPIHTIVGEPIEHLTGSPLLGSLAEAGAGFVLPVPKGLPRGAATLPEESQFGVTLSGGEKANDLAMRQKEQQAIRSGDPHAQEWLAQRQTQLANANDQLVRGLDPFGQTLAETPQEAGQLVSQGVQSSAANAKTAVQQAYAQARALPGQIHSGVFEGMSQGIKGDLTLGDNPVIIDDKTTPFASKMIDDLDNRVSQLKIQNKADPFGAPNPENIVGVDLNGVDQMRKRLSAFRKDAYASGNAADGRAAQAVLSAFDDRIDGAINGGQFTGDPSAVKAWNNARAANADYRSTFTAGKNDPVGRVVQKIIGDNVNDPLTPGKVMDQIVGASRTAPSALNIGVANRLKSILGEQSPEWIAAKQGLLKSLVEPGAGETGFGTGQVAQRLSKFLNTDMAGAIYTPQEQATLRAYANLNRQITMPPGSYFPSAPPIQQAMAAVRSRIGGIVGALIGRQLVPIPLVGELAGLAAGSQTERALERLHSGVAKQLPIVGQQIAAWSRAQSLAQAAPNPTTQALAKGATLNLQRALNPLGVQLSDVMAQGPQGPGSAYGAPQQQNIPGPPPQQHNGGAVRQKSGFAHGGAIKRESESPVKVSKFKAHYQMHSRQRQRQCHLCTMFQPPRGCSAVSGTIAPHGVCDLFRAKKEAKHA
jgi:hypothetical protein